MFDFLYRYNFSPSEDIVLITIDNDTINTLQSWSFLKMLTVPKSVFIDLVEKLESVDVKGIAFDIIFQNPDPEEEKFAETLAKYNNIVLARMQDR